MIWKLTLFLEILEEGDATLFRSFLNATEKFFYKSNPDAKVKQLLYKKYFLPRAALYVGNDFVKENREYLRQLSANLPCFNKKHRMFYPDYDKLLLIKYFKNTIKGNVIIKVGLL